MNNWDLSSLWLRLCGPPVETSVHTVCDCCLEEFSSVFLRHHLCLFFLRTITHWCSIISNVFSLTHIPIFSPPLFISVAYFTVAGEQDAPETAALLSCSYFISVGCASRAQIFVPGCSTEENREVEVKLIEVKSGGRYIHHTFNMRQQTSHWFDLNKSQNVRQHPLQHNPSLIN